MLRCARCVSRRSPVARRLHPSPTGSRLHLSTAVPGVAKKGNPIPLYVPVLGGFLITVAGGIKYMHDLFGGTEGLKRSVSFYSVALPKYAEYRYHQYVESPQETWDELDKKTADMALRKMLELRGFYIKSGQICAANIGNAFPKIWQETLSVLQDQVPHKDMDVVRDIVETEYGKRLEDVFSSFEETPIGAASIGQVHRATLLDGQRVVVKVMYPEVERLFRGDVRTIKLFAQLAQPVHVPAIDEIEKQFMTEFDYVKEAQQLEAVRNNLIRAGLEGDGKLCRVPRPFRDLCTKRVLVMEELKGNKLQVELMKDLERNATRSGKSLAEFQAEIETKEKEAAKKGEQFVGPSPSEYSRIISLLDKKRQVDNTWKFFYNSSVAWLPGSSKRMYQSRNELPLNHAKLIDDLLYIHGHEVCVDGKFNGDAHPGNILLLGVEEGRPQLGLIDYGQVPVLSKKNRIIFCKLVIALAEDNRKRIVQLMKEAGYKSKNMNEENMYLYAKVGYDEDNDELTGGDHIQIFLEKLQAKDPIETLPRSLLMVSRTSTMLRGLAHALHQSRSIAQAWKPIAEKALRDEGEMDS